MLHLAAKGGTVRMEEVGTIDWIGRQLNSGCSLVKHKSGEGIAELLREICLGVVRPGNCLKFSFLGAISRVNSKVVSISNVISVD